MDTGIAETESRPYTPPNSHSPDASTLLGSPAHPSAAPLPSTRRLSCEKTAFPFEDQQIANEQGIVGRQDAFGAKEPVPDNDLGTEIDDLLAGLGEDDLNDFNMDDFGDEVAKEQTAREEQQEVEEAHDDMIDDPFFAKSTDVPAFVGFSTARGGTLKGPSSDALARVRRLFEDEPDMARLEEAKKRRISDVQLTPVRPALPPPRHSAFSSAAATATTSTVASSETPRPPPAPASSGFQTGNGRAVAPLSAASRARAMAIFLDEPVAEPSQPPQTPTTLGFQTGLGRSAPAMSASSRAQAVALFEDEAGVTLPMSTPIRPSAPLFQTPTATTPSRVPLRTTTNLANRSVSTPKRLDIKPTPSRRIGLGSTPSRSVVKKGFVTPFKGGLPRASSLRSQATPAPPAIQVEPVFDMTPPPQRKSMRAAFLYPQFHSINDLQQFGIPDEIWQLNPTNAVHYQFIGEDAKPLGIVQALSKLKHDGGSMATMQWVENHWAMIMWKIAGQVAARPELFDEKWTWYEVVSQLKYRYEREYNLAQRPLLRRVLEHDSAAGLPMVLCVSHIHRPPPVADKDGNMVPQRPAVALSDGWYRVKAQLDECLVRAVAKGKIKVGRKLAISGAKLESADSAEAIDAYDVAHLVLSGNSCHLARWDARLGLQGKPFIASLDSLSPDGGVAVLVDIVVVKAFALGFVSADKGQRELPWSLEEEEKRVDEWQEKYESERARLQEKCQKSIERVEDLAQLLASYAEDAEPDGIVDSGSSEIDTNYELLLSARDASVKLRTMSSRKICALAQYAARRVNEDAAAAKDEMEAELRTTCSPREVRSLRMVRVRDAREGRKESTRTALLNVWDARELGTLKEGGRYMVSNLMPGRQGDWRLVKEQTEVFLHTRRDSRWHYVKAAKADIVA